MAWEGALEGCNGDASLEGTCHGAYVGVSHRVWMELYRSQSLDQSSIREAKRVSSPYAQHTNLAMGADMPSELILRTAWLALSGTKAIPQE